MGNRRFAQVATSDEEEDDTLPPRRSRSPSNDEEPTNQRKRKRAKLRDEEDEEGDNKEKATENKKKNKRKRREEEGDEFEREPEPKAQAASDGEEEAQDAKPIGDMTRVSGKGRGRRSHYESFEYDGLRFDLEDPVLLVPEETNQKPYVAIIKDITQAKDGSMMITGQWFYRPEEAERKGGGNWQSRDTRELFYSFHRDEVPAESVMHKCVVHFIPLNKQIPSRKEHPGFIVQKVYDTEQRRLFKLTDKDYEDSKQHEIDLLVQKTMSRLGDLPDIESEENAAGQEDQSKNKRLLRRKSIPSLDVSREEETSTRSGQSLKLETPGSCASNTSEYFTILSNFKVLTGETQRDKWLDKLLQVIHFICSPADNGNNDGREKGGKPTNGSQDKIINDDTICQWPDAAVRTVAALENAAHETLSLDFQKYNQKMRQLAFNLKNNTVLGERLLKGELEPLQILSMSPDELKRGLTAEEIASREPEEAGRMQMTDARCKRCAEKNVGLIDIIQAGHGDRYQLECIACGNTWYASRDEASTLTIDGPSIPKNIGTAPLATAKFEDVEKMVSPSGSERAAGDILKKTTEAYLPALDTQRSFKKLKSDENSASRNLE